jgi:hypothetical protein
MTKKSLELDLSKLIGFKQMKATSARATAGIVKLERPQAMVGLGGGKLPPASPDLNA